MPTDSTLIIVLICAAAVIVVVVLEIRTARIIRERQRKQRADALEALRKKK